MKKKVLVTLALISALLLTAFSAWSMQKECCLLSVDISDTSRLADIRAIDPAVYFAMEDSLIIGVTDRGQIDRLNLPYRIIDNNPWSGYYYLVSDKRGRNTKMSGIPGDILYYNRDFVLIKRDSKIDIEEILATGYHYAPFEQIPVNYDYSRVIVNTNHSRARESGRTRNPDLSELLDEINPDSLAYFIQKLEDFETRFVYADNRYEIVTWIKGEFQRFGIADVELDPFIHNRTNQWNVVATIPGSFNPESIVIIGGHHDSIAGDQSYVSAPGADDNASGTAAALEIARAMMAVDYVPEATIRFITFAAEEVGLNGSHHYASKAEEEGMNIKLMINNDMIAYNRQTQENPRIHLIRYSGFENYANFSAQITEQHTNLTPILERLNSPNSDSLPFWRRGYAAIFFFEWNFNPYYHTVNDRLIHLDMDYAIEAVRASAAIAMSINDMPDVPGNLFVQDAGNGTDLIVRWEAVTNTNLESYMVYVGLASGNYFRGFSTQDTTVVLDGLETGRTYYIGVSAEAYSGYTSAIVEQTGVPREIPLTPVGFKDRPHRRSVTLKWQPNLEADLAGYRLFRSEIEGVKGEPVIQELITDSNYNDSDIISGNWYYYSLQAVDEDGNGSDFTEQVKSRLLSFDQGVLIVSDTSPGNGSFLQPTIDSITSYYGDVLHRFSPDSYNLWEERTVKLADIGAYSTLVWHKNSSLVNLYDFRVMETLKSYLDMGGNLIISTLFPSRLFDGHHSYPVDFQEGSFIYDYLKIKNCSYNLQARFQAALGIDNGYPALAVDEHKAPEAFNYHLFQVESIQANSQGKDIYFYETGFDEDTPSGKMKGLPVGVEYLGDNYKTVTLSFPLYNIKQEHSAAFFEFVLSEKFNETVHIEDALVVSKPKQDILKRNYPNPFNPETAIEFNISEDTQAQLTIYNIKGQLVATLFDGSIKAGEHRLIWNGKDESGKEVGSGVYLYRLKTDGYDKVNKMLLVK